MFISSKINSDIQNKNQYLASTKFIKSPKPFKNNLFSNQIDSLFISYLDKNIVNLGNTMTIFKKIKQFNMFYPKAMFYKNNYNLPAANALNTFLFIGCHLKLKMLLSRLFWNLKVTDHKFILLWLRRVFKHIYSKKKLFNIIGISFLVKGKLGVTGNKRKRTFKVNYGPNSSTKINAKTQSEYFTIRTTTGVIGVTLSITYNH